MVRWKSPTQHQEYRQRLTISSTIRAGQVECARNKEEEEQEEEGKHRGTEDTEGRQTEGRQTEGLCALCVSVFQNGC